MEGGREGGSLGGKEPGREGGREGAREGAREGGSQGGREGETDFIKCAERKKEGEEDQVHEHEEEEEDSFFIQVITVNAAPMESSQKARKASVARRVRKLWRRRRRPLRNLVAVSDKVGGVGLVTVLDHKD